MKLRNRAIKAAFTQAIQDRHLNQADAGRLLIAARTGQPLSADQRHDLEAILAQQSNKMSPQAQQSIKNFLKACVDSPRRPVDTQPPPTPRVRQSRAFEHAEKDAIFRRDPPPRPPQSRPYKDPIYIEWGEAEVGSKLEFINLSAKPDARFDAEADVQELVVTGRDVQNRQAAVYLSQAQMKELGIEPGDVYQLRAVDQSGNASLPVTSEFEPDDWADGWVTEGDARARGGDLSALDGEATRKQLLLKAVNDTRPPLVVEDNLSVVRDSRFDANDIELAKLLSEQWTKLCAVLRRTSDEFETELSGPELLRASKDRRFDKTFAATVATLFADTERFEKFRTAVPGGTNGLRGIDLRAIRTFRPAVYLKGDAAVEPRARVSVLNARSGETFAATVNKDRTLSVRLGDDVKDGDPLVVSCTDNEGVEGKLVELVYSSRAPQGKAPKLTGGLAVRLSGVI